MTRLLSTIQIDISNLGFRHSVTKYNIFSKYDNYDNKGYARDFLKRRIFVRITDIPFKITQFALV